MSSSRGGVPACHPEEGLFSRRSCEWSRSLSQSNPSSCTERAPEATPEPLRRDSPGRMPPAISRTILPRIAEMLHYVLKLGLEDPDWDIRDVARYLSARGDGGAYTPL